MCALVIITIGKLCTSPAGSKASLPVTVSLAETGRFLACYTCTLGPKLVPGGWRLEARDLSLSSNSDLSLGREASGGRARALNHRRGAQFKFGLFCLAGPRLIVAHCWSFVFGPHLAARPKHKHRRPPTNEPPHLRLAAAHCPLATKHSPEAHAHD